MDTVTEIRLAMRANGYDPIPVRGKRPAGDGWQLLVNMTPEIIQSWPRDPARIGASSGALTKFTGGLDADIKDPDAAEAIRQEIGDWFGDRGTILQRVGEAPKFLTPFRVEVPFNKIKQEFRAPNGTECALEFLCDGQQFVAAGIHPGTKKPYAWRNDRDLTNTPRQELPGIGETEAHELIDYLGDLLVEKFGYERVEGRRKSNGHDPSPAELSTRDFRTETGEFDVGAWFAAMPPTGDGANEFQPPAIRALLLEARHPDVVLQIVAEHTLARAKPANPDWTYEEEAAAVSARRKSVLGRLDKEYDPTTGTVPGWLPGEFHEKWIAVLKADGRPQMCRNAGGWYVGPKPHSVGKGDGATASAASGNQAAAPKSIFVLRPFVPFNPATLPPRQWLYGRHYQRSTVSITTAPGGFGKTTLVMVEAIAMATGRDLLGEQPAERLRVWYHNGEDTYDELQRRLAAICQHYRIPQEELVDRFFMTTAAEVPLRVATGYNDLKIDEKLIACINAQIDTNAIDLAVLDPLITLHGVSEQDNSRMDTVIRIFAGIAGAQECGIALAHHNRKQPAGTNGDYGASDMRGASAIHDAVRAVRVLNRMSEKDANDLGISEQDRKRYFRVDDAKSNNSPAAKAVWRQFVNVDLPNGDEMGVVAAWELPNQGAPSAEKTEAIRKAEHVFLEILHRFNADDRVASDSTGKNYAPTLFADEKEAQVAKLGRIQLKAAMIGLLADGRIRTCEARRRGRYIRTLTPAGR